MGTEPRFRLVTTRALLAGALCIAVACLLDHVAWRYAAYGAVYEKDWGRLLRSMGFLPTWLAGAAALLLHDRGRAGDPPGGWWRRGLLLALAPAAAGLGAEVLKILLRRERPGLHDGAYAFRAYADHFWSTRDIGLPSSHAMVAGGAAAILSLLFPRTWPVWWLLAAGCALTRVLAHAHFLSDATVGLLAGALVARALWARWGPPTFAAIF